MKFCIGQRLLVAALIVAAPAALRAQRPTAAQAQQLLQSNPDLVAQLRQRIMTSGMTADQIRARLRAEGYPENLLDAYLPGGAATGDSSAVQSSDVFAAVMALGIADSADVAALRLADSTRVRTDTIRQIGAKDSLARRRVDSLNVRPVGLPRGIVGAATSPDSGYYLFGLDVFQRSTTQFDPNLAGPVDANYRVGPGDRLVIVLTGDVEAAYDREVTREGFIVIPQVGQVQVSNLTLGQVEDVLYSRLGRVYSGVRRGPGATTHFSVSPARLRSNQVYVLGDVQRPGSYRISAAGTVLTALYAAGGPNEVGSLRHILVRRGGATVDSLDSYDYLLRGDATRDARLQNGDVVFVPTHGARVRVVGEVIRPATYEIKRGETVDDLILAAGGFTAKAGRRRIQIERITPPEQRTAAGHDRQVIDITADQSLAAESGFPIAAGDVVRVFAVTERVRDRITVEGAVWTPGALGFTPGMMLSQALRLAGGVKPDVYMGEVLISRLQSDSTRVELRASLRDTLGNVLADLPLNEDDQIRVFSVTEFRPTRYVAIAGAVRKPGRFPYREGMTLRDLVLLAGGLLEKAHLQAAEVARLPQDRSGGKLARTIRVPLDSSYLFDRLPNGRYLGPPGLPAPREKAPEVPLQPYDNVLIMEQPDWSLQRIVVLTGEVRFPGTYALQSKSEHLSDLISRAGGLTDQAYADGVYFFRRRGSLGRIGIDLPRVLRDSTYRDNLILQDGDSINLPQFSAVVDVRGAVRSPVAVAYVPGQDIGYYIAAAGGLNRKAEGSRAYVVQPNGKVESISRRFLLPDGMPKPRPGSVVMVPEKDPNDKRDYSALASAAGQVAASLVAVVAIIVSRPRN